MKHLIVLGVLLGAFAFGCGEYESSDDSDNDSDTGSDIDSDAEQQACWIDYWDALFQCYYEFFNCAGVEVCDDALGECFTDAENELRVCAGEGCIEDYMDCQSDCNEYECHENCHNEFQVCTDGWYQNQCEKACRDDMNDCFGEYSSMLQFELCTLEWENCFEACY